MFNKQINHETGVKPWHMYKRTELSCPCGCELYLCTIDLVNTIKEIQLAVGDEDLEFRDRPCCNDYAYRIGERPGLSKYTNGTAIEIYKPASLTVEEFEEILDRPELEIKYKEYDEENEIFYIDIGEQDD